MVQRFVKSHFTSNDYEIHTIMLQKVIKKVTESHGIGKLCIEESQGSIESFVKSTAIRTCSMLVIFLNKSAKRSK